MGLQGLKVQEQRRKVVLQAEHEDRRGLIGEKGARLEGIVGFVGRGKAEVALSAGGSNSFASN